MLLLETMGEETQQDDGISGSSSSSRNNDSSCRRRKHSKKKSHRKRSSKRKQEDEESSATSDAACRRRRKDKKQKKRKKHRKHERDGNTSEESKPSFGKYGILKREDFSRMQRTLEVWLDEVKSISASVLSRRDLQNYFEEFREDFNTATMPHKKFYNFDAWEQAQWNKAQKVSLSQSNSKSDEQVHAALRRKEDASVKLDTQTIADMKHQGTLRTQMQVAFRTGDTETYERLRRRLNDDS